MKTAFYLCVDNDAPEPTQEDRIRLYDLLRDTGYLVSFQEMPKEESTTTTTCYAHASIQKGLIMEYGLIKRIEDSYFAKGQL